MLMFCRRGLDDVSALYNRQPENFTWQTPPSPRGRKWLKFSQRSAFEDGKIAAFGQATHMRVIKGYRVIAVGFLSDGADEKEVVQNLRQGSMLRGVKWTLVPLKPQWDL